MAHMIHVYTYMYIQCTCIYIVIDCALSRLIMWHCACMQDIIPSELEVGEGECVMEGEGDGVSGEVYGEMTAVGEGQDQNEK